MDKECVLCGHKWIARVKTRPVMCPGCHSKLWDGRDDGRATNRGADARQRGTEFGWEKMQAGEMKAIKFKFVERRADNSDPHLPTTAGWDTDYQFVEKVRESARRFARINNISLVKLESSADSMLFRRTA